MRILRSIHTLNPAGGGPIESVRQSSSALNRLGHEVEIICTDTPDDPWLKQTGLKVHALGPGRSSYGYASRFLPWLRQHHHRFDVVLVHGIWQYIGYAVWRALRRSTTPYFVFPHGMLDPWFARRYPLKHLKKKLYWPIEARVLEDAQAVLFTSEEEKLQAHRSGFRLRGQEEIVAYGTAPPAVDLDVAREMFLEAFPVLKNRRLLLFLGRLHTKKGCELLLEAVASLPPSCQTNLQIVFAGPAEPPYLREIKRLAENLFPHTGQVPSVIFTGMLQRELKWGAFAAAEVFVLPSHQENFGIAVAEALACGTPVLISNKVNIWREIVDAGAGFADEDTVAGTARLLERWLGLTPEQRREMAQKARRCFAEKFHIDTAVESLLAAVARYRQGS
jgi:glycosyltransferase involved in cell wall biosynthesis